MIRTILRGAVLRRDAYLRMVLSGDGVADGLLIVGNQHRVHLPRVQRQRLGANRGTQAPA